jgi:predicted GNAT family N-acyltransferase
MAPAEEGRPTVRPAAPEELDEVLALRHEVFCVEQGVPLELERDGRDGEALHLVAMSGPRVVGTCRLLRGRDQETLRLGRMAVARDWRGRGIGEAIIGRAHFEAVRAGARRIVLAAQVEVQEFYARLGYVPRGAPFEEAGIAHVVMSREVAAAGGRSS